VRKNLPPHFVNLLFGVFFLTRPSLAVAGSFSRCEPVATNRDCIPGSGTAQVLIDNAQIQISKVAGTGDTLAFNWPVKNCLQKSDAIRGQVFVILDNSKSEATTDRETQRAPLVKRFLDNYSTKAASSGVSDSGNAAYPKIALMNYNGRSGTEDTSQPIDSLNAKFDPDYCNKTTDLFPSAAADARWGQPADELKTSICEYLSFAAANDQDALRNMKNFVDYAAPVPRGSTDFTYFFKASNKAYSDITNSANVGRNVVVVTDGLPNVPKYVSASVCRTTPRLVNEAIITGTRFGVVQDYCIDRQTPTAIVDAHAEALKSPFGQVNVHHILFTADSTAYFDYDNDGKPSINPAAFLIENSARTGNGKVKFSYARGADQLSSKLDGLFETFDKNALQYVKVVVTPASGSQLSYNAVSPSAPGSDFDIKFVGLKSGTNNVTVTPVYQDGRDGDSASFTIVVGNTTDATLKCSSMDDGRTVDGDLIGSTDPIGDGFYVAPNPSGQFRDFRNADPGNKLDESVFGRIGEDESLEKYTRLRLQGGTGNCGTLAGLSDLHSWRVILVSLLLLAVPVLISYFVARSSQLRAGRRRL
jgi:hypothetical protein